MSLLTSIKRMFGLEDEQEETTQVHVEEEQHSEDLSGLKLSELRDVAKSRGLKGYTKLRKAELLSLLSGTN